MYWNVRIGGVAAALLSAFTSAALGQAINEDLKVLPNDGAPNSQFGYSIASDQGVIAIGAPYDGANGVGSGSAYLFNASTGVQITKLTPGDGVAGAEFGASVAIHNGIVAVGALRDEHDGVTSGSAYLFDATTGMQIAKLTPDDAAAGDEFGHSVAIHDGIVAVGAMRDDHFGDSSGSAYLFDASTGDQLTKLLPDEGAANQNFGVSIAMDDGIVAIGSRSYFVPGEGYTFAAAYLFDASNGDQLQKFVTQNINGDLGGRFSDAIDIDNGVVAVGAWGRSIFFDHSGAAYTFDAATGKQIAYIVPSDGQDRDYFGRSISIDNGVVAIGADGDDDNGWAAGSAYLYDANTGDQIDKLLASDGDAFDLFGSSVTIDDGLVAVGAIGDQDNGDNSGSVYVFGSGNPIDGDFDDNGLYDCADIDALIAGIAGEGAPETYDLTGDGNVDLSDRDAWLAEAAAANGLGSPYLPGDADLSGTVDFLDLNKWSENRFTASAAWCSGDWDASGFVDFLDLNLWSENRFQSSDAAVPEPAASIPMLLCVALVAYRHYC